MMKYVGKILADLERFRHLFKGRRCKSILVIYISCHKITAIFASSADSN